jgi:N-methylhydantoinase B
MSELAIPTHATDPITMEVIRQDLVSIPNQIDKNITRTAFSAFISEYKDYSVGIVDATGQSVSQSRGSLAIFVANALGTAVRDGLEIYGAEGLKDGDIVISNHAGTLGQHLNNVVMYTPVIHDGQLMAFFCVLMHWIDIGGMMIGSCSSTTATEIFQEGLQLRTVKLFNEGRRNEDMLRVIRYNTRFPEMLMGDIEAQIGGCLLGKKMVQEIAVKYGADSYHAAVQMMWDQSDQSMRAILKSAPDGIYKASSFLDNDGIDLDSTVPIHITVKKFGDQLTVDFSEVSPQRPGPLNAGRNGGAVAAARVAVKYLFSSDQPVNEGDFRALDIVIPEGTFISAGQDAALGSSGNMIPTVVDTVIRAMAEVFPERVAAAHHGTYGVHAFHGKHPVTGRPFYNLDTICGGWGATSLEDGYGPSRSNLHGDTSNVPIEMQEATCPYVLDSYVLRPDSGGAGQQRGGIGVVKVYRVLSACRINLKIDRTKCLPWGLKGGQSGKPSGVCIMRKNGDKEFVLKGDHPVFEGDRIMIETAGGGGYGDPLDRSVAKLKQDLAMGYVTPAAATAEYGVIFTPLGVVDEVATEQYRAQLKSKAA